MLVDSIVVGIVAAILASLPELIHLLARGGVWLAPASILLVTAIALGMRTFLSPRLTGSADFQGPAELLVHIHSPAAPDSAPRWGWRSFLSTLLAATASGAGPEGGAIEGAKGALIARRPRFSRWFEQHLRTDAAQALAAGVSAAFGAPFAGFLASSEMGLGGRASSVALASISAFAASRIIATLAQLRPLQASGALEAAALGGRGLLQLLFVAIGAGLVGAAFTHLARFARRAFSLGGARADLLRIGGCGVLLFLLGLGYSRGIAPPRGVMEELLWSPFGAAESAWLLLARAIGLAVLLAGFGPSGYFWPLAVLGGTWGACASGLFSIDGNHGLAVLTGAAALWGAVLGMPLAGAALVFEVTHSPLALVAALAAALLARKISGWLGTRPLVDDDLQVRGIQLVDGRSANVMGRIPVADAMVTDIETVHEQEPVSELSARLLRSRYAFLPVVDGKGRFTGLLTVDMLHDVIETQRPLAGQSSLSRILEARDILYRSGYRAPSVRTDHPLTAAAGLFARTPCVTVVDESDSVVGLLLSSNVRLAYDREVARQALAAAANTARAR